MSDTLFDLEPLPVKTRWILRCRCGRNWAHDLDPDAGYPTPAQRICPKCSRPARSIKPVVGRHSDDALCNAACTGAVGPDCECQCGGMNHARALTGGRG